MKISHADETENNCDYAPEFNFTVAVHTTSKIIANDAMIF